jgi:hypothetical protein
MAAVYKLSLVLSVVFSLASGLGFSQKKAPPLERLVSIKAANISLGEVLKKISEQGQFSFSYNTKSIDTDRKISVQVENKPVRSILHFIFKGSVLYKSKNNYIILSVAPRKETEKDTIPKYLQVSGYTFNKPSSEKLKQVSIFEENTLLSTVSDSYGYFSLQVPNSTEKIRLKVNKEGYHDTILLLTKEYFQAIEIVMVPFPPIIEDQKITEPFTASSDTNHAAEPIQPFSAKVNGFDFLLNSKMKSNLRNLSDTFFRKVQLGIVPPLSTNKLVSPNVTNNVSLNLLAGYSGGVKYAEVAGLLNVNRGDVHYFQAAGLANAVGGKTKGFQAAGLSNVCFDNVTGAQFAGLFNVNLKNTTGTQGAGLFNYSKTVRGAQVAGLFNFTKKLKGVQIAPFNIADSSAGIPIGVFSFVKRGYHKIELSADEVIYGNIAFRTGVEKLHNIFTAGVGKIGVYHPLWSFGYGLGTSFHLSKKFLLDIDLVTNYYHKKSEPVLNIDTLTMGTRNGLLNMNNKLYTGIEWQIAKKISLAMGPTLNIQLTDTQNADYANLFNQLRPSYLSSKMVDTNLRMNMWIGGKIAIRFL